MTDDIGHPFSPMITGDVAHWLGLEGVVNELYDVSALPGLKGRRCWVSKRRDHRTVTV